MAGLLFDPKADKKTYYYYKAVFLYFDPSFGLIAWIETLE